MSAPGIAAESRVRRFQAGSWDGLEDHFRDQGYVVVDGLFSPTEIQELRDAIIQETAGAGQAQNSIPDINDTVLLHDRFAVLVRDQRIVSLVKRLLGCSIELQHSKYNPKPLKDEGGGLVEWHQDYPFFPHTNFDLVALGLHLDDETEDSGPVKVIPGSHRQGLRSHCRDGRFVHTVTEPIDPSRAVALTGPAGMVTVHHSLMLHGSEPKRGSGQRRLCVFEFRAQDAIQIAGPIWRSTGMQVEPPGSHKGTARFMDGTRVEIRGKDGRLFDPFGRLAPNKSA